MSTQLDQPDDPPSDLYHQRNRKTSYPRNEAQPPDILLVSSIPIFVMDDNSTEDDEPSVQESRDSSPMSEGNRMDVARWVRESSDGAFKSDETVVSKSSSRDGDAAPDGDEHSDGDDSFPEKMEATRFNDGFILEGRYDDDHFSLNVLPGVFGEPVHHGTEKKSFSFDISKFASSDLVQEETDMPAGQIRSRDPNGLTHGAGNFSQHQVVDEWWMQSLLDLPWINKDLTMIFDTQSKKMVAMPRRKLERKKAVIDLYSFIIRGVWFIQLSAKGDWMQRTLPEKLWGEIFTLEESHELQSAVRKKIHEDVITRAITVVEEWRLRSGFAKVPETEKEVIDAEENKARLDLKCMILKEASIKSVDRWIKYVFQGVMDAEHLDIILSYTLLGVRQHTIVKLIQVTEMLFCDCWTVGRSLKQPLNNRRKVESVIEGQLAGLFQNLTIHDERVVG